MDIHPKQNQRHPLPKATKPNSHHQISGHPPLKGSGCLLNRSESNAIIAHSSEFVIVVSIKVIVVFYKMYRDSTPISDLFNCWKWMSCELKSKSYLVAFWSGCLVNLIFVCEMRNESLHTYDYPSLILPTGLNLNHFLSNSCTVFPNIARSTLDTSLVIASFM